MESSSVGKIIGVVATLYTILLTIGSLIKPVHVVPKVTNFDKLLHAGAYFGLAVLWLLFYFMYKKITVKKSTQLKTYLIIALILIGYGIVIEVMQGSLTIYRQPDVWDVLANTIGVLCGCLCFALFFKKFKALNTRY